MYTQLLKVSKATMDDIDLRLRDIALRAGAPYLYHDFVSHHKEHGRFINFGKVALVEDRG